MARLLKQYTVLSKPIELLLSTPPSSCQTEDGQNSQMRSMWRRTSASVTKAHRENQRLAFADRDFVTSDPLVLMRHRKEVERAQLMNGLKSNMVKLDDAAYKKFHKIMRGQSPTHTQISTNTARPRTARTHKLANRRVPLRFRSAPDTIPQKW